MQQATQEYKKTMAAESTNLRLFGHSTRHALTEAEIARCGGSSVLGNALGGSARSQTAMGLVSFRSTPEGCMLDSSRAPQAQAPSVDPIAPNRQRPSTNETRAPPCGPLQHPACGLKWRSVGAQRPAEGMELQHAGLSSALHGQTEFNQQQWDNFGIEGLEMGHYIQSGATFYKPSRAEAGGTPQLLGYSRGFAERYEDSYAKFVFIKSPKAGLIPRTKWEQENQGGTVRSPIYDRDHPLFNREEYEQERRHIVGGYCGTTRTEREISEFGKRQMEAYRAKEELRQAKLESELEKWKGLDPKAVLRLPKAKMQDVLQRLIEAEKHKKANIKLVEDRITQELSFTPGFPVGIKKKKWDPKGQEFHRFLQRQQEVMRTRLILAERTYGNYAPVPRDAPDSVEEQESEEAENDAQRS